MESKEVDKELGMTYSQLVGYLLEKYGPAKYDYFVNDSFKTKNNKISRTSEGLFCHHIDEDKAIMLSTPLWASKNPFEYQKADRLVYCNALEHLILHVKIATEPRNPKANPREWQGIGGALSFMCPELNHCYSGFEYKRQFEKNIYGLVANNFDDYIKILKYFISEAMEIPELSLYVNKERLSKSVDKTIVDKVYNAL